VWLPLLILAILLGITGGLCFLRYRKTRKSIWLALAAGLWVLAVLMLVG
jgi:hypothetical protein